MDLVSSARMALRPAAGIERDAEEQKKTNAQFQNKALAPNETVLGTLTDVGLSGLAMAGNLLDVPGSMVRDVSTWVPGGVAASNPFDQLLSPFSSKNRVSGQELVEANTGIDQDSWTGFGTGLALEIGMDPLTYLTLGGSALGKGGAAIKAAGFKPKDITRVANKIAKKELGESAGRKLGATSARQTVTPRQILDNAVSDEVMSNARMSAINEARKPLYKQIDDIAAKESWTDDAVEAAKANIDNDPVVIQAGQRAEREVYEQGVRQKYEDFKRAGGTEEMLDEKLGGIAKFSIPFISKKYGDKYPLLRERLLGTTKMTPGELADKKWFGRVDDTPPGSPPPDVPPGSPPPDIPPGSPDVPTGGPDIPSSPDIAPDLAPEAVRPGISPKDFEGISPKHARFSEELNKLTGSGILDEGSAGLVREIFRDSSLDTFDRTFFRAVKEIVPESGELAGKSVPGRTVPGNINKIELSQAAFKGRDDAPLYATETLLHELGHSMLSRSATRQADAGVDVLGEFQKFIDDGTLEDYFRTNHSDRADYFLGNSEEAFSQIFADSVLRRKPAPPAMQGFIDTLKEMARKVLEKILRNPNTNEAVAKKADAMVDLIGGFMDAEGFKALYSKDPKIKEAAEAVVAGSKGGVDSAVKAGRAVRATKKAKESATQESLGTSPVVDDIIQSTTDPDGIIDELLNTEFSSIDDADAAADLATARFRELQGNQDRYVIADYEEIDGKYRLSFIEPRKAISEMAAKATKPTRRVQAREAALSPEMEQLDELVKDSVFDNQDDAVRAANEMNAMVPENLRATGAGYVARELDNGTFTVQKTNVSDDGLDFYPTETGTIKDDVASLLENRDQGLVDSRMDDIEAAVEATARRASPAVDQVDEVVRSPKQILDEASANRPEDILEDEDWLRRFSEDEKFQAPRAGATADEAEDAARQWREKGTDSPYFRKWFGDSKVVDETGEPARLYHATTKDFSKFIPGGENPTQSGRAIYLGSEKLRESLPAAHNVPKDSAAGARTMPVYARMQNPLVLDSKDVKEWASAVYADDSSQFPYLLKDSTIESLKQDGYDGIKLHYSDDPGAVLGDEYIVFNPEQIKSATGNTGAFDGANPDIRYQSPKGESFTDMAFDAAKNTGSFVSKATSDARGAFGRAGKATMDAGNELFNQAKELFDSDIAAASGVAMDSLGGFVKNSTPVRILTANLSPSVMGGTTELAQEIGREHYQALEEINYEVGKRLYKIERALSESDALNPSKLIETLGDEEKARATFVANHNAIRRFLEDASPLMDGGKPYELPKELEPLLPVLDDMRSAMNQIRQIELDSGLKSPELEDTFARYLTRQMHKFPGGKGTQGNLGKALETGTPYQNQRLPFLKNIPGGTATLNEMSIDSSISGIAHSYPNKKIPKEDLQLIKDRLVNEYGGGDAATRQKDNLFALETGAGREQIDKLVDWLTNLDPKYAEMQVPVFKLDPVADVRTRMQAGLRASAAANFSTSLLARGAVGAQDGGMSMADVVARLAQNGMDKQQATSNIVNKMGDKYTKVYEAMQAEEVARIKSEVEDLVARTDPQDLGAGFESGGVKVRLKDTKENGIIKVVNPDGSYDVELPMNKKTDIPTEETLTRPSGEKKKADLAKGEPKLENVDIFNKTETVKSGARYVNVKPDMVEGAITPNDVLKRFSIDNEVADSTFRYMRGFTEPESVKVIEDALRQVTNLYKSSLTVAFPAFHVRNFISGQYNNFLGDAFDPRKSGPSRYTTPIRDANKFMLGEDVPDVLDIPLIKDAGITDVDEAMDYLRQEITANRLVVDQGQVNDIVGDAGAFGSTVPQNKRRIRDVLLKAPPLPAGSGPYAALNPLGGRGILGNDKDTFLPFRWGRQVGEYVEGLNRVAPYLAYLRQGMDSQTAARKVMELQFDYSKLTPTDRKLRLLFPFYTYTKNIIPLTINQLIERPGGKLAQTIRAGTSASSEEPMPDHIAKTAAIPFGRRKVPGEGDRSFITGLGFGFEDALSFAGILGGDMQGTFREVASRSNPLLKFGLEQMTGESTYFDGPGGGRALTDLDPTYGRIRSNITDALTGEKTVGRAEPIFGSELAENVLANLPTSRIGTTLRTITDSRKIANPVKMALNLGTGVKVSDVSEASWDAAMQNKAIEKMKDLGAREFTRRYFPDYIKERMSEGELTEAEGLNEFLNWLADRAKNRKAEREAQELLDSE